MSSEVSCGVALHPAGHTLSPVLHEAAYLELELDAHYEVFDIPPDAFPAELTRLRTRLRQLSVSLPHKEEALARADSASSAARAIGAANTLTMSEGGCVADNTDWIGVLRTLEPHGSWRGRRATVLGAGGAARAVVYALLSLGMEVVVANRTRARAERLVADLGGRVGDLSAPYDLLVNATSVGMDPHPDASPAPGAALHDRATVIGGIIIRSYTFQILIPTTPPPT